MPHQGDMKRGIPHIVRFSGESRVGFLIWPQNGAREPEEKDTFGVLLWLVGRTGVRARVGMV